ncbi:hypothetical protein M8J77_019381, partial [Diaphorina citri]
SVLCDSNDSQVLHTCLLSVQEVKEETTDESEDKEKNRIKRPLDGESSSKLVNVINWISLHRTEQGWCLKRQRQIHVPGVVHYLALNKLGSALYLLADKSFTFVSDSEKQILPPEPKSKPNQEPAYFWQQTNQDVTLWFPMNSDVTKGDVNISVTNADIRVTCRDKDLLSGNTVQTIDANLTTWKIEKDRLEIVLQKSSPVPWTGIVRGDERGEEILDPQLVEEVHQRLAHLCSDTEVTPDTDQGSLFNMQQLEECDSMASEDKALVRIDGEYSLFNMQQLECDSMASEDKALVRIDVEYSLFNMQQLGCDSMASEDKALIRIDGEYSLFNMQQLECDSMASEDKALVRIDGEYSLFNMQQLECDSMASEDKALVRINGEYSLFNMQQLECDSMASEDKALVGNHWVRINGEYSLFNMQQLACDSMTSEDKALVRIDGEYSLFNMQQLECDSMASEHKALVRIDGEYSLFNMQQLECDSMASEDKALVRIDGEYSLFNMQQLECDSKASEDKALVGIDGEYSLFNMQQLECDSMASEDKALVRIDGEYSLFNMQQLECDSMASEDKALVRIDGEYSLFNMQQLEECDSMASEDKALVRIDGELHCSTHHMNLGGHQCLFSASLSPTQCPALCLRHDVDGALLQIDEDGTGEVSVKHEGTLQAFGYVQASKTQRKFSTCAPDMSYGVICESSRHVFLYVQSSRVTSELRHRVTGRRVPSVSKQYVVTLTDNAEVVLGVIAARACLYLLTSVHLYMIKVES